VDDWRTDHVVLQPANGLCISRQIEILAVVAVQRIVHVLRAVE